MSTIQVEILCIALLTAITCVIPGVFLVLRGMAMMSDAISHALLLGIAGMFLWVRSLESPLLFVGASLVGILTVVCTEGIIASGRLKKDAAISLVFPLFFSIGVILISWYARNVHLDADMVLLGELAFTPFNRLMISGYDMGPSALWTMGFVLLCNTVTVLVFYKELVLTTFDATLACMSGFYPVFFYYFLMIVTSVTAVAAFDVVGSVMVVALMITPPATAYLITRSVGQMIVWSVVFAGSAVIGGYMFAVCADVSIAGSIVTMTGVLFLGCLISRFAKTRIALFQ